MSDYTILRRTFANIFYALTIFPSQDCMRVPLASVRYTALQGLVTVLKLIETLPASDARVFAE